MKPQQKTPRKPGAGTFHPQGKASVPTHIKQERLRTIRTTMLYKLHSAQNCCHACPNCRDAVIDAITEYARSYAAILHP